MTFMSVTDAARLISMEYAELPGLSLTFWQVQRLFELPPELCERALSTLVASGVLRRTDENTYIRVGSSPLVAIIESLLRDAS
jgi:DNA-binding IclR family transcriptional regulator